VNTIDQCHVPTPGGTLLYNDGFGPRCGKVFPCPDHPPRNGDEEWHRDKQWHRMHPIYYTPDDLKAGVTPEVLIEKLRSDLTKVRGKLFDLRMGYGWDDRLDTPEHGITLVIMALHGVVEEMKKSRQALDTKK